VIIGIWNNYKEYSHNRIFEPSAYKIGDDLGYPIRYFRDRLRKGGHSIKTLDEGNLKEFDAIYYLDHPSNKKYNPKRYLKYNIPCYLIVAECEMINKNNVEQYSKDIYTNIFTYNDAFVDGNRIKKYNIPHHLRIQNELFRKDYFQRDGFLVMIAGNKRNSDPRELYSARLDIIKWFEDNVPQKFDLYGFGWDKKYYKNKIMQKINNRVPIMLRTSKAFYKSYRGSVDSKNKIYARYKYAICYENAECIQGYITEKIFDCMIAGCIPVYRGAPNVEKYISKDCFVNGNNFISIADMYKYLNGISEKEYNNYRNNILEFLHSEKAKVFSAETFVKTITKEMGILN